MTETIKAAVIGCGRISGHHCNSIADVDGMEMVAVCDLVEDKARAYGATFGIAHFTNYRNMLAEYPDISVVAVATPSGMHAEHGMELLQRHGKHLIMEKPTFMRPDQLVEAFATADALGLRVFPVFQNRYNKAVQRVQHAIQTNELGDIRIMSVRTRWCRPQRYYDLAPWRGTYSHDGGALTNQGIHHVDLLRYLGGEIERVDATMRTLGANIEVEDTVVATFTYGSGAVGNLEVTTAARPDDFEASLSIVGSKGFAQIGGIAVNELQIFTPDPNACIEHSEDFSGNIYGNGHSKMYRDIARALSGEADYPVSGDDALATLHLLHSFYRSDEVGSWVDTSDEAGSVRLGCVDEAMSDLYRTPELATVS